MNSELDSIFTRKPHEIKRNKEPLARIHISDIGADKTAIFLHGFADSIYGTALSGPALNAHILGYNVAIIQTPLSVDFPTAPKLYENALSEHIKSLGHALKYLDGKKYVQNKYNVFFGHSMGGTAFEWLSRNRPKMTRNIAEPILSAPFFLNTPKMNAKKKSMSDEGFKKLLNYSANFPYEFNGVSGCFPGRVGYFWLPLEKTFGADMDDMTKFATAVFGQLSEIKFKPIHVILAENDDKATYETHLELFKNLPIDNKSIHTIANANHYFGTETEKYNNVAYGLLEEISERANGHFK